MRDISGASFLLFLDHYLRRITTHISEIRYKFTRFTPTTTTSDTSDTPNIHLQSTPTPSTGQDTVHSLPSHSPFDTNNHEGHRRSHLDLFPRNFRFCINQRHLPDEWESSLQAIHRSHQSPTPLAFQRFRNCQEKRRRSLNPKLQLEATNGEGLSVIQTVTFK